MAVFGSRRRAARVETVPEWVSSYLLDGEAPAEGSADHGPYVAAVFLSGPSGARDLWAQHEVELLARWVAQHPGSRPWAWWRFSAAEGRRQTSGAPIMRGALHDQVDAEGLPQALNYFAHGAVGFESQAACLKRLGLLVEGEGARVTRSQFRPRTVKALAEDEPAA